MRLSLLKSLELTVNDIFQFKKRQMGDCQNYGPFLGPYCNTGPNTGPNLRGPKKGPSF